MEIENKKQTKPLSKVSYIALGILLLLSAIGISVAGTSFYKERSKNPETEQTTQNTQSVEQKHTVTIQDQSGKNAVYETKHVESETALDLLKRLDAESDTFTLGTKEYSFGTMVVSINGYEPDSSKQFWSFEVNGNMSSEGVSAYKIQKDDSITFKIESIQ
jgi:hypothetical protein